MIELYENILTFLLYLLLCTINSQPAAGAACPDTQQLHGGVYPAATAGALQPAAQLWCLG